MRRGYATGPPLANWTRDFRRQNAPDEEYQCRLWPANSGLIHEYQTDSSSKQPAP